MADAPSGERRVPDRVPLDRWVGGGEPCYVVAEIGINHQGNVETALKLIDLVKCAGSDAVKFQKKTPELTVPKELQDQMRDTPWGERMTYLEYRRRIELDREAYDQIALHCQRVGIAWTASVWDEPSLAFLLRYDPPWIKVPSACLTDLPLLEACRRSGKPVVLSTGMSTLNQIQRAVTALGPDRLVLLHCTSTYPCAPEELNLHCIETLHERFRCPVGYSGHHPGVWDGLAAAVLGAALVEKHVTFSRAAWGTDHAASLEPAGLERMVRYIRQYERARGDGEKRVYESERPVMARLRRVP